MMSGSGSARRDSNQQPSALRRDRAVQRLCFHCDLPVPATVRIAFRAPGMTPEHRFAHVCADHVDDELAELRHLGFIPRILRS